MSRKESISKVIGKHRISEIMSDDDYEEMLELMAEEKERLIKDPVAFCMKIYALGYINGKRNERTKKAKGQQNESKLAV